MRSQAVRGPLVVGLGTASILAAATIPAFADPSSTPTPSASPDPSSSKTGPPPPSTTPSNPAPPTSPPTIYDLYPYEQTSTNTAHGGDTLTVDVLVYSSGKTARNVSLHISANNATVTTLDKTVCALSAADVCRLASVKNYPPVKATFKVVISNGLKSGTVKVKAWIDNQDGFMGHWQVATIKVTPPPKPSASKSTSGSTNHSGTTSNANNNVNHNSAATTPNGAASSVQPPDVANLPNVGSNGDAQNPSVAAPETAETAGSTTALRNGSTDAQELTFQRLASTQAAWLASLLIILAMLLTQVRLGRRPDPAAAGNKPAHRRPRKGRFQA